MPRRAARIDNNQHEIVDALRAVGCNVAITSSLGSGFVDLVVFRPSTGLLRLMEVKDGSKPPSRQRLTPDEEEFARKFPVWVVHDVAEALAAMGVT